MASKQRYDPALDHDRLTPFDDVVVGTTTSSVWRTGGHPTGPLMRGLFVAIQLLDGFENTRDDAAGKLAPLLEQGRFVAVSTTQAFTTAFRTLVLYRETEAAGRAGLGS